MGEAGFFAGTYGPSVRAKAFGSRRRYTVGIRRMRSLEAHEREAQKEPEDEDAFALDERPSTVPGSGPSQSALHQFRRKRDPVFIEYEDTEQKSQSEKRWLLEVPTHLGIRTRGLKHYAIQDRVTQRMVPNTYAPDDGEAGVDLPRLQNSKAKKQLAQSRPQSQQSQQQLGSS